MRTEITAGQTSDYLGFDMVMADKLPTPSVLLADRGYDADRNENPWENAMSCPSSPCANHKKSALQSTPPCIVLETLLNGASTR